MMRMANQRGSARAPGGTARSMRCTSGPSPIASSTLM